MNSDAIIVPLDGSEHALVALPVAKHLAGLQGATLHLVHVAPALSPSEELLERIGLRAQDLRGLVLDAKTGDPASGIIEAAREFGAALIVLCTHTATAASEKVMGSTALGILKGASCPVVLVRPERGIVDWELRRILLPHDGTPTTSAAIRPAAELARRANAALDVLYVAKPGSEIPAERGALTTPLYADQPQHEWPSWMGEFIERLSCVCSLESLNVRMVVAEGEPGDATLRFAAEHASDLIVLAWRGEWDAHHAAAVKTVIRRARCPVMVTRATGEPTSVTAGPGSQFNTDREEQ